MFFNLILASGYNDSGSSGLNLKTILLLGGVILVFGGLFFLARPKPELRRELLLVKDQARDFEKQALNTMGEQEFARLLVDFEMKTEGIYEKALHTMATSADPKIIQIGFCWLDRKGYGELTLNEVQTSLDNIRINNR